MKLIIKTSCLLVFSMYSQIFLAQLKTYSFEEVDTLSIKKPIVVFLHTDWCRYCKTMQKNTFTDKAVIDKLNTDYYYIPFDVESKQQIVFRGEKYNYKTINSKRGIHALAEDLGSYLKRVKYPSTVVLNSDKEVVHLHQSKLKPQGLLRLLNDIEANEKL